MVYKISGEFNNNNFSRILGKLSKSFVFIYTDKTLFVAFAHMGEDKEKQYDYLKRSLSEIKKVSITEIDENNMGLFSPEIIEWCRNNLVRLEAELYEIKEQNSLKNAWLELNKLESTLEKQLQTK